MADAPDTDAPDQDTPDTDTPDTDAPDTDAEPTQLPDDHPLVKAHRAKKDELAEARKRLKAIDDADKSELERANDAATSEKERADNAEAENARLRAAIKHGLSDDDLKLLGSGSAEDIEARAAALAKRLAGDRGRRPTPGLGEPDGDPKENVDDWLRSKARR